MAHITLIVCDECARQGSPDTSRQALTYMVQQGTTRARIDLCSEHDTSLRNILIGQGDDQPDATRPAISEARFEELCATMDDVQKAKRDYVNK